MHLKALARWMNRHRVASVFLVLLALCFIKPTTNVATHLFAINCGSFDTGIRAYKNNNPLAEQQAALCFSHAHQQCQPATLQVNYYGLDTSSSGILSTANSLGGCLLTLAGHSYNGFGQLQNILNFFLFNDALCRSLSLQPTELDLQHCDFSGHIYEHDPFLSWGNR